jgi:hypothetical protein
VRAFDSKYYFKQHPHPQPLYNPMNNHQGKNARTRARKSAAVSSNNGRSFYHNGDLIIDYPPTDISTTT